MSARPAHDSRLSLLPARRTVTGESEPGPDLAAAPDSRTESQPQATRARAPGPWSRALFAVFRPSVRGSRGARSLTLLVAEMAGRPEGAALHEVTQALIEHDRVLLPAIRAYRGRRIMSCRASLLAAFVSPTDAVLCGMAIQDLLALRNAGAPAGEPISVRLALHLGETRLRRGRVVGSTVELARVVCGVASCGEVWLTRSVHLAMNHVEVAVEPLMPVAAGGDREPIPVYRVRRSPGEIPYGGREAHRVGEAGRLGRALEPIADAIAAVEEGTAEGRAWAALRVTCAAAAILALGMAGIVLGCARAGSALAASLARRRGGASPLVDGFSRWLEARQRWIGSRRSIPRAALIRPLW